MKRNGNMRKEGQIALMTNKEWANNNNDIEYKFRKQLVFQKNKVDGIAMEGTQEA